jgi:putative N6-adenine-specific DNA methylase
MNYTAKTLYGLEALLAEELGELGASNIKIANRAVYFTGNDELLYLVNYCSRLSLSVLKQVCRFDIRSKEDLYRKTSAIEWDRYMDYKSTFAVVPVVNSPLFSHTGYPALIVKDAIADHFRNKSGVRPSVNVKYPDLIINLHISADRVSISLDSSGDPLFMRGYRKESGPAPLNEVLAAGILKLSGWKTADNMIDPMCGAGTIPIEAALMASNIPPGRTRVSFGFEKWKDFDDSLLRKIKSDCEDKIVIPETSIKGSDIDEKMVDIAIRNSENAGVSDRISFSTSDLGLAVTYDPGTFLIFNPPYGERLNAGEAESLYSMIGTTLKHKCEGTRVWMLTTRENMNFVGLKPRTKHTLFNGSLECVLAGYEIYSGSRKQGKQLMV